MKTKMQKMTWGCSEGQDIEMRWAHLEYVIYSDKRYKWYQEDVLYSFQKIKTWRAGLEDLQPCCDTKFKGY